MKAALDNQAFPLASHMIWRDAEAAAKDAAATRPRARRDRSKTDGKQDLCPRRPGVHYIPTYTTKEPCKGEYPPGIFRTLSQDEFFRQQFMVRVAYQGDYYGIKKDDILTALKCHPTSLILLDAGAITQLHHLLKSNLVTIFLMTDYVTLVSRMLKKGCDNDTIKYQLEYAESNKEYEAYKETDFIVKNTQEPHVALKQILTIMGLTTLLPKEKLAARLA